jgi:hypothetical protein
MQRLSQADWSVLRVSRAGNYMKPAWCAVILLAALLLLPTLLVDIPAMADYLNHLARMHVLADAGTANANKKNRVARSTWNLAN